MKLYAPVEDGKLVESASQNSLGKINGNTNEMDKDAFLQLLVAQMKYQDPLQPTSNTEYISQYAQFSQVEQMNNMSASMDLQRASQLVGKDVYVKTTTSSGATQYVQGKVDYVVFENNKAYLAINESLYSIDDLDTVHDPAYLAAYEKATDLVERINRLPNINTLALGDGNEVDALNLIYSNMTQYEKTFVASEKLDVLKTYTDKIAVLRNEAAQKEVETEKDNTEDGSQG